MSSFGIIKTGRLVSLESGNYPQFMSGLDASKTASPGIGDTYYATDTGIIYNCFVSGIWSISGSTLGGFNLLKIYTTNIFTEVKTGTGTITPNIAAGILTFNLPANEDDASIHETDKIAPSLLPRIMIFRIHSFTMTGGNSIFKMGLSDSTSNAFAGLWTTDGGANWFFFTQQGVGQEATAITAPAANDFYIIYSTSARSSLFKNGVHIATHTTTIPTGAIGHYVQFTTAGAEGAGNKLVIGYMS